jgi:hypothetical protein
MANDKKKPERYSHEWNQAFEDGEKLDPHIRTHK